MKAIRNVSLSLFLLSSFRGTQLKSVSYNQAYLRMGVLSAIGGLCGGLIGKGIASVDNEIDEQAFILASAGVGAGVFGLVTGIILSKFTPRKSYAKAQKIVEDCNTYHILRLIEEKHEHDMSLVKKTRRMYVSSDFPILRATFNLEYLRDRFIEARKLFKKAMDEMNYNAEFVKNCTSNIQKINEYLCAIDDALVVYKELTEYTEQRKAYNDSVNSRRLSSEMQNLTYEIKRHRVDSDVEVLFRSIKSIRDWFE